MGMIYFSDLHIDNRSGDHHCIEKAAGAAENTRVRIARDGVTELTPTMLRARYTGLDDRYD
jgi:hypothetical protein